MSSQTPLVLLHGWGMNSAVWSDLLPALPEDTRVLCPDLPGHGKDGSVMPEDIDTIAERLLDQQQKPAIWLGWSLGGLVTARIAELQPDRVKGLIQVATNPRFVSGNDWVHGIERTVFDGFATALKSDIRKTIGRFLALQVTGAGVRTSVIRSLRASLDQRGHASQETLETGLRLLMDVDLRQSLHRIEVPVLWLLGERDKLVPVSLSEELRRHPQISTEIIEGASHAPFISHRDQFTSKVGGFITSCIEE